MKRLDTHVHSYHEDHPVFRGDFWTLNTHSRAKHVSSVHRMLCRKSSDVVAIPQKFFRIERSSGSRCAFREQWYGCSWYPWNTSRTLGWNGSTSRAKLRELLHGSRSTFTGCARTVPGRPAFSRVVCVTLPVSRSRCSNRWSTLVPGWRRQDNVARIPTQQYQLYYCTYRGLKACHSIRLTRIPRSFDNIGLLLALSWVHLTTR
jgi:hypothetical protein